MGGGLRSQNRLSMVKAGCEERGGLLAQRKRMGPALWEDGVWEDGVWEDAATQRCSFVRGLAAHGITGQAWTLGA